MTSQDKNEPDKRANRDWTEDHEAILASLTREESGDEGNGPTTDDEQVTFFTYFPNGALTTLLTSYVPMA